MTERKRPSWKLHWPSWLALVVFGGAFVVLNVTFRHNPQFDRLEGLREVWFEVEWPEYVAGWPYTWAEMPAEADFRSSRRVEWLWRLTKTLRNARLHIFILGVNAIVGLGIVGLSIVVIESFCGCARLTIRNIFGAIGVASAIIAISLTSPLSGHDLVVAMFGVALAVMCIAIGLASLAVLDFIGWLFSRLSKGRRER